MRHGRTTCIWMLAATGLLAILCFFALNRETALSAQSVQTAYVSCNGSMNIRSGPGTSYSQLTDQNGDYIKLVQGTLVEVLDSAKASNGATWYQVRFAYNGQNDIVGYGYGPYITIYELQEDPEFEAYMQEQGFPESYRQSLRILHSLYPEWIFTAQHTGLVWADAVAAESAPGQSLAYYSSPTSWKDASDGNYDWEKDAWIGKDGSNWHAASTEIVQYYLDPRNFLTEKGVFQFEQNSYNEELHTLAGIQQRLDGTFMEGEVPGEGITYAQTFLEAAAASSVSPYMLVARCIQEMGVAGTSRIISGTVAGYESLYNYFDIGAYTTAENDAIINGLIYASKTDERYMLPWNTRYRSLVGGSIWIGSSYIARGQDTLYLQKFNVQGDKPYTHQYMTNIQAASNEGATMYATYTDLHQPFIFKIPVYLEMPEDRCICPTGDGNPNPYLKTLEVSGQELTPGFSYKTLEYDLVVAANVSSVTISATSISAKATISGTGKVELSPGENEITVVCTAEYGNQVSYVLRIYRMETQEVITTDYRLEGEFLRGVEPQTDVKEFLSHIQVTGSTVSMVVDAQGVEVTEGYVATGYRYCTQGQIFSIVIRGDVCPDGEISLLDMLYIKRSILGIVTLDKPQQLAAEVRVDGNEDVLDMLYVKRHILGISLITQ